MPLRQHRLAAVERGGAQAGRLRGVELADGIGQEQDLVRRSVDRRGDDAVGRLLELRADARVEIAGEERREVAERRVAEHQALRLHRARRIDVELDAGVVPAAQCRRHIGIDVADQFAAPEAVVPDQALQRLQRRRLLVGVDPVLQQADGARRVEVSPPGQRARLGEQRRDLGVVGVGFDKFGQMRPRIREQLFPDEGDRGRRSLDIGDDGGDFQSRHVASRLLIYPSSGMAAGAVQSFQRSLQEMKVAGRAYDRSSASRGSAASPCSTRPCCRIASPSATSPARTRSPRRSAR